MCKSTFFIVLISAILSSCNNHGDNDDAKALQHSELSQKIDNYIKGHLANGKFKGSVLVAQKDSILFQQAYGLADLESNIPHTDSTKFLIGSITKPFTALAILLLEKEGKLSLNDSLSNYFPDFPNGNNVTIHHLLTHTSGIRDYHALPDWKEDSQRDITPNYTVMRMAAEPFDFEPGTSFRYSNTGYILLGLIIEKVSKQSFEQFIQKVILGPLELKNTGIISNGKAVENLAKGYTSTPLESKIANYINYKQPFSSGNMYSTPTDLWKFTKAVMYSEFLGKEKTTEVFENNSGRYGYGWGIREFNGLHSYGHHGGMNGFVGSISWLPEAEIFICFLTNDDNTPKSTIASDLASIVRGQEVETPSKYKIKPLTKNIISTVSGDYLIKRNDTIHVFSTGDRLFLQETGQAKHELFNIGDYEFITPILEFGIQFSEIEMEKAQVLSLTGGSSLSASRVNKQPD